MGATYRGKGSGEEDRSEMKPYYEHGGITIYHGDCREVISNLHSVDLILTDPPYSSTTHTNAKTNKNKGNGAKAIAFDPISDADMRCLLSRFAGISKGWIVATMDWRHIAKLEFAPVPELRLMRFGVWVKPNPMPQISADRPAQGWEGIAYLHRADCTPKWFGGGKHGNFWLPVAQTEDHPTEKPMEMLLTLVDRFSTQAETILDPFMGSGTTLRAAKDLGRKAIGIEREERYVEIACKRLSQEVFSF